MVKNGSFYGTGLSQSTHHSSSFSWADIGRTDLKVHSSVYLGQETTVDFSPERAGIFEHYSTGAKLALVLYDNRQGGGGTFLELMDGQFVPTTYASQSCNI